MFSYWEQESFTHYRHIVIGSGIVGLSTAIELRRKYPDHSVLVLERGLLPTGASTRNAGFVCMGSATELLDDMQHMHQDEVLCLFEWRKTGLDMLRSRLGDDRIGYAAEGSHDLLNEAELDTLEQLDFLNQLLWPILGKAAFREASERIDTFGLDKQYTRALIESTCEGAIHTGKMMRALTDFALLQGVEIKTGAVVQELADTGKGVEVSVEDPFRKEVWRLSGQMAYLCTNAFTRRFYPDEDVVPGRGQVLITHPVPGLRLKGIYHFDKGYYYFRELDGRVLFGGGRNLDFEQETTTDIELNDRIQADLEEKLRTVILPHTPFTVDLRWAGIMAFGASKFPIVKAFSPHIYGACRMGGMGVALGSKVAQEIADLVTL